MAGKNTEGKIGLLKIKGCDNPNRRGDVIFVHGLMGNPITTWHPEEKDDQNSWLYWLPEETQLQNIGFWTFGYEAEASAWVGNAQHLFNQGKNLLTDLENDELGQRPLIFVTHSLGGLVVKEMLRSGKNYPNLPRKDAIIQNTKGIIFLATPHIGADLTKTPLIRIVRLFGRENVTVTELETHSALLQGLDEWYRQNVDTINSKGITTQAYFEEKETWYKNINWGIVVDENSADPKIKDVQSIPVPDADHLTICKPIQTNKVYKGVKLFIQDLFSPIRQLPPSPSTNLTIDTKREPEKSENFPQAPLKNYEKKSEGRKNIWQSMVKILDSNGNTIGSGFIIRSDGYFITCHQAIYNLDSIKVEYQGKKYFANWDESLSNKEVDIAILKIDVENAKPIQFIIPKDQMVSALVYGFSSQSSMISKSCDVYETLGKNLSVNTISTYDKTIDVNFTNSWNKKPKDTSTFSAYKINEGKNNGIDKSIQGGAVLNEESDCVIGIIQSSQNDETYVINWDNIIDCLKRLEIDPNELQAFSTVTPREIKSSKTQISSEVYLPTPEYKTLLGRDTEIENIKEILSDTNRRKVIGVDGFGGIGKTALVQEIVKSFSDVGFKKVIWQTASTKSNADSNQMTFETVIDGIATQLNRPDLLNRNEKNRELKINQLKELLQEQPALIVLDNMETSGEPQKKIIQKLLPILGSSKALLTSRHRFTEVFENNLWPIHLRGVNQEAAVSLMEDTAIQKNMQKLFSGLKTNELEEMIQITGSKDFGYTPLALKFILGQHQMFDPKFIVDSLKDVRLVYDKQISEDDEFQQFWSHIFLNSCQLLSALGQKFMEAMHHFEPNTGSNDERIMKVAGFKNLEFAEAVTNTWKLSFLEIRSKQNAAHENPSKIYYLHRLSYLFINSLLELKKVFPNN